MGRTIVVHDAAGARVACGVLEPANGLSLALRRYPGYRGSTRVHGLLLVGEAATPTPSGEPSVVLSGLLAGLPPSSVGGYHVHSGFTCDAQDGVFGHYGDLRSVGGIDPWASTKYTTDAHGVASLADSTNAALATVGGYTLERSMPVAGRAVVVHDPSGARVACGLIGVRPLTAAAASSSWLDSETGLGVTIIDVLAQLADSVGAVLSRSPPYDLPSPSPLTISPHHRPSPSPLTISPHHLPSPSPLTIAPHHLPTPSPLTISQVGADWIDTLIVTMRSAGPGWVTVFSVLAVSTATVLFFPVFLQVIAS